VFVHKCSSGLPVLMSRKVVWTECVPSLGGQFYNAEKGVLFDGEAHTMMVWFLRLFTMPEGVVFFLERPAFSETSLLKSCNVHIESIELIINDGGLSNIINLYEILQ